MSSSLQQMQLTYNEVHDRLILVLYTQDFAEYRFWITRHALKKLWMILMQLLQGDQKSELQHIQENRQIAEQIQHEKEQRQSSANKFATQVSRKPLGEEPLLLAKIMARPVEGGKFMLHLEDLQKHTIEFGGDSKIILALCQLILQAIRQTDWDLQLSTEL